MITTDSHYIIGRKRFVRVTTLLDRVGHSDFSAIPKRDYFMSRGKAVHELAEHIERGIDAQYTYDAETEKYRPAILRFLRETGFKAAKTGIEKFVKATWAQLGFPDVAREEVGVAGTLDRWGAAQGRPWLVDYKGHSVPPSTAAQTAFYAIMDSHTDFSAFDRYGVSFRPDGTYRMSLRYPNSDFHLALSLAEKYLKGETK